MGDRIVKQGAGWRLGWDPTAPAFQGLVGTEDWAIELTAGELEDFCQLLGQLADTMHQMTAELMTEEHIACEMESDRLWLEVEGFCHTYTLRLLLRTGRRCEGYWSAAAVPGLIQATRTLNVF
ncbi:MAG: DUF1818 family protein [Coleofasciculaceae cyanobacterium SM2_3_26]|nr:DUF1818 family protein [Coleofasciculaceae cyanobacterium SM2_3_26]